MDMQTLLGSLQASDPMMGSPLGPMGADPMVPTTGPHGMPITGFPGPQSAAQGPNQVAPTPGNMMAPQMPMQGAVGQPSAMAGPSSASGQPTLYERIMSRLFHTPTGLQQYLSPQDVQAARSQALLQMGARMMGAGLPPGSSSHFGMNLANTLAGMEPAYQGGLQQALQAQQTGMGLAQAQNQMKARQALGALEPPGPNSSLQDQLAYATKKLQIMEGASLPEATAAAWEVRALRYEMARQKLPSENPQDWELHNAGDAMWMINKKDGTVKRVSDITGVEKPEGEGPPERVLAQQERDFNAAVKPVLGTALAAQRARVALTASRSNPAAYGSALVNYIKTAENGAQLRQGMLQYFAQNVDPSVAGKFDILASKLSNGTYPQQVVDNMLQHVGAMSDADRKFFHDTRADYIKRYPELDRRLLNEDALFGGAQAPPSAKGGLNPNATYGAPH